MKIAPLVWFCTVWGASAAHAAEMDCGALAGWLASQTSISSVVGEMKPGRCELTFTYSSRGDTADVGQAMSQVVAVHHRVTGKKNKKQNRKCG